MKFFGKIGDPIGVSKTEDWPTDEYQSYVPDIYNMVISNANRTDMPKKLFYYESELMEMPKYFRKLRFNSG